MPSSLYDQMAPAAETTTSGRSGRARAATGTTPRSRWRPASSRRSCPSPGCGPGRGRTAAPRATRSPRPGLCRRPVPAESLMAALGLLGDASEFTTPGLVTTGSDFRSSPTPSGLKPTGLIPAERAARGRTAGPEPAAAYRHWGPARPARRRPSRSWCCESPESSAARLALRGGVERVAERRRPWPSSRLRRRTMIDRDHQQRRGGQDAVAPVVLDLGVPGVVHPEVLASRPAVR